eukprot:UN02812
MGFIKNLMYNFDGTINGETWTQEIDVVKNTLIPFMLTQELLSFTYDYWTVANVAHHSTTIISLYLFAKGPICHCTVLYVTSIACISTVVLSVRAWAKAENIGGRYMQDICAIIFALFCNFRGPLAIVHTVINYYHFIYGTEMSIMMIQSLCIRLHYAEECL